jgi:hypothetical protein
MRPSEQWARLINRMALLSCLPVTFGTLHGDGGGGAAGVAAPPNAFAMAKWPASLGWR